MIGISSFHVASYLNLNGYTLLTDLMESKVLSLKLSYHICIVTLSKHWQLTMGCMDTNSKSKIHNRTWAWLDEWFYIHLYLLKVVGNSSFHLFLSLCYTMQNIALIFSVLRTQTLNVYKSDHSILQTNISLPNHLPFWFSLGCERLFLSSLFFYFPLKISLD